MKQEYEQDYCCYTCQMLLFFLMKEEYCNILELFKEARTLKYALVTVLGAEHF